jgi:hypothetical protein
MLKCYKLLLEQQSQISLEPELFWKKNRPSH